MSYAYFYLRRIFVHKIHVNVHALTRRAQRRKLPTAQLEAPVFGRGLRGPHTQRDTRQHATPSQCLIGPDIADALTVLLVLPSNSPAIMYNNNDIESDFFLRAWQIINEISDQLSHNQKFAHSLVAQAHDLKVMSYLSRTAQGLILATTGTCKGRA